MKAADKAVNYWHPEHPLHHIHCIALEEWFESDAYRSLCRTLGMEPSITSLAECVGLKDAR